jgi:aminopeptidase N
MILDDTAGHRAFALAGSSLRYGPDKLVDVLHIDLHLVPDLERATLEGVCTTTVRALDEPVSLLSLDAVDLRIASVERDGKPLNFAHRGKHLDITFDPAIAPD